MADLDSTLLDLSGNFKSNEPPQIFIPTMNKENSDRINKDSVILSRDVLALS